MGRRQVPPLLLIHQRPGLGPAGQHQHRLPLPSTCRVPGPCTDGNYLIKFSQPHNVEIVTLVL